MFILTFKIKLLIAFILYSLSLIIVTQITEFKKAFEDFKIKANDTIL